MPMMLPPRVLVVMSDQWPRALLRAALREVGYDAVGARSVAGARRQPLLEPGRGAVALAVVDQDTVGAHEVELHDLLASLGNPPALVLAHATRQPPAGAWTLVIRRPVSVDELVTAVQSVVPLPDEARRPVDDTPGGPRG